MRKVFLTKPVEIIHLCLSLMKELERSKVEALVSLVLQYIKEFWPLASHPS
jgi:hypothetical protein